MGLVPEYDGVNIYGMHVAKPGAVTQVGCVWCLKENIEAPAAFDVIYYYSGTSACARHIRLMFTNQGTS